MVSAWNIRYERKDRSLNSFMKDKRALSAALPETVFRHSRDIADVYCLISQISNLRKTALMSKRHCYSILGRCRERVAEARQCFYPILLFQMSSMLNSLIAAYTISQMAAVTEVGKELAGAKVEWVLQRILTFDRRKTICLK